MSVDVVTFGCRLNAAESEVIRREATRAGFSDTVVVYTCAVTTEAVRQARQAIRSLRRRRPNAKIIVTGCAAQTEPHVFAAMPESDGVLGNGEKLSAAGCTFCIIPFGRGNSRSVPMGAVIEDVRRLVANGYCEIVLTGVDITSYGADLPGAPKLGALVKQILKHVPELHRLRLSSIDSVDRELFEAVADEPRLMPHLHLSLQSGDDLILKRMKRRHDRAQAIALCRTLRGFAAAGHAGGADAASRRYGRARTGATPARDWCAGVAAASGAGAWRAAARPR